MALNTAAAVLFVLAVLSTAAVIDDGEALREESDYCDRLQNKVHTDYNDLKETCAARYWSNKGN